MAIYSKADEYAVLKLFPNEKNTKLQVTLDRSIVITDERQLGALYIQSSSATKISD
jgi:hypothetical protein